MFAVSWASMLLSALLLEGNGPVSGPIPECLLASERARLQQESRLDNRIRIYERGSVRCLSSLQNLVRRQEFAGVPDQLRSWVGLLEDALKDIEARSGKKAKSRALIQFEIHLRKSIAEVQELKVNCPVEQQVHFEAWLDRAEHIRKRFVDILFQR